MACVASTVVSTVSSAPFARDRAVTDVAAQVDVFPMDLVGRVVSAFGCVGHAVAEPYDAQDPAAGRDDVVAIEGRTGMEDLLVITEFLVESVDALAPGVTAGIAPGRQHDAECPRALPCRLRRGPT